MGLECIILFECSVAASGCLNGSKGFWNHCYVSRSQFLIKDSKKMNNKQKNMKGNNILFVVASLYLRISIWFILRKLLTRLYRIVSHRRVIHSICKWLLSIAKTKCTKIQNKSKVFEQF